MVKQTLERYGSQPFNIGDAFIGAVTVLAGIMVVLAFNYDPEQSKQRLANKIELLEGQIQRLHETNLEQMTDIADLERDLFKMNLRFREVQTADSRNANKQFFDMMEKMIEKSKTHGDAL